MKKTFDIYRPNCAANCRPDKWLCEVRNSGFIADWKLFDTKEQAETWGNLHTGETSYKAASAINDMVIRWANK